MTTVAKKHKRFPTKERMQAAKVYNSWHIASLTASKVYIAFSPQMTGRGYRPAHFQIMHIGFKTDPTAHWQDYGNKTFNIFQRMSKEEVLQTAIAWANKRYGEREWVRDPWGSYQDASAIEAVWHEVAAHNNLTD